MLGQRKISTLSMLLASESSTPCRSPVPDKSPSFDDTIKEHIELALDTKVHVPSVYNGGNLTCANLLDAGSVYMLDASGKVVVPLMARSKMSLRLVPAEDDGEEMDGLPPFSDSAEISNMGIEDFLIVDATGPGRRRVLAHIRLKERRGSFTQRTDSPPPPPPPLSSFEDEQTYEISLSRSTEEPQQTVPPLAAHLMRKADFQSPPMRNFLLKKAVSHDSSTMDSISPRLYVDASDHLLEERCMVGYMDDDELLPADSPRRRLSTHAASPASAAAVATEYYYDSDGVLQVCGMDSRRRGGDCSPGFDSARSSFVSWPSSPVIKILPPLPSSTQSCSTWSDASSTPRGIKNGGTAAAAVAATVTGGTTVGVTALRSEQTRMSDRYYITCRLFDSAVMSWGEWGSVQSVGELLANGAEEAKALTAAAIAAATTAAPAAVAEAPKLIHSEACLKRQLTPKKSRPADLQIAVENEPDSVPIFTSPRRLKMEGVAATQTEAGGVMGAVKVAPKSKTRRQSFTTDDADCGSYISTATSYFKDMSSDCALCNMEAVSKDFIESGLRMQRTTLDSSDVYSSKVLSAAAAVSAPSSTKTSPDQRPPQQQNRSCAEPESPQFSMLYINRHSSLVTATIYSPKTKETIIGRGHFPIPSGFENPTAGRK